MNIILHIYYYKLISFIKISFNKKIASVLKNVGTASVYILFGLGVYFFTQNTIKYLLEEIRIGSFLLHRFASVILFIFFMAVNIGNTIVSFSTLYKSEEVSFLMSKPIVFHHIFIIKFLDNFFHSSITLLLIIAAVLFGYGSYFSLGLNFYLTTLFLQIIPFMLTAACLGVILLIVILKLAEKFGIRKIIAGISLIYLSLLILFFDISNPILLVTRVMEYYPDINRYFGFLDNSLATLLPNFWLSEAMYWISNGSYIRALPYIIFQIILSLIFLTAAIMLAKRWYYNTWVTSRQINFSFRKRKGKSTPPLAFGKKSILKPQLEVLVKKEFWLFFRDPSQYLHMIVILVLIGIFVASISNLDVKLLNAYNTNLKTVIYLIVFLFNVFLIASLALRFVFPLVSLEGQTYWKIKSSPINSTKLLMIKFFTFLAIVLIIGLLINYFSHFRYPFILTLTSSINTLFVTITLVSLNFAMGSMFANFNEKNPIKLASSQGASLTFLFTIIYLVFLMIILFFPIHNFFSLSNNPGLSAGKLLFTSSLIGIIALLVMIISLSISSKSLRQDFH
jgi:ABC-2 type transport system permease protein